jgi:hypothetical protein
MENRYKPRTIVHARGQEWIVLPERQPEVSRLKLVTGAQGDEIGLIPPPHPEGPTPNSAGA